MATLFEYHLTDTNGLSVPYVYPSPDILLATTFTPDETHTITFIRTKLHRNGLPGTIYIKIYYTAGDGSPDIGAGPLSEMTRDGDALSTNPVYYTNYLPEPIEVSAGVGYAIVITAPSSDLNNQVAWRGREWGESVWGTSWLYSVDWPFDPDEWNEGPHYWDAISNPISEMCFQIWGEEVFSVPDKPTNPSPAPDADEQDFSAFGLSWDDGGGADTYNVYIGPVGELSLVSAAQVGTTYTTNINEVPIDQKIYWRVDATNSEGTTTGDTWNFDARPAQISTTVPAADAEEITLDETTTSWDSPSDNTTSYDAYFGIVSESLFFVENTEGLESVITENNFDQYDSVYLWRVDAVNQFGTTQGVELGFTTIVYDPPVASWRPIDGGSGQGPGEGEEGTDWGWSGGNNMLTVRRLIYASDNKIWFEDVP